nr:MAG TPA: hypothetical protein [Bacteriophage sp.]
MKACSKNKVLAAICNRHGINLYHHQLDGTSWQICAGGYVVNGYSDGRPRSELLQAMNVVLVLLLKYGSCPLHICGYERNITWRRESHAIMPIAEPLRDKDRTVYTSRDKEDDEWLQAYFDLQNS